MLGYYKKHILELTKRLRELENDKDNFDFLIETQLYILKRIIRTEGKINELKNKLILIKNRLRKERLSKHKAATFKKKCKLIQERIKKYKWLLYVWRCFGDGIAFIYLDKWAIKPFLYDDKTPDVKQSAGHIKDKEGLYREFALVLEAKKRGVPALLNDLTNTIRHGDVCLLGGSDPFVIEVKSSSNTNRRTDRQIEKIRNIHDYLKKDEGKNVRGANYAKRMESKISEVNYRTLVNKMISEALKTGSSSSCPELGIYYYVLKTNSKPDFDSVFSGVKKGIVYTLNEAKNKEIWGCYYPFTLLIREPEALYAFLKGEVYFIVVFDADKIRELAKERGFSFSVLDDVDWAFRFDKILGEFEEPFYFKVSQHFAVRMAFEFFSIKWVLDHQIDLINRSQEPDFNESNA